MIFEQQFSVLFLERMCAMMLLLLIDVAHQLLQLAPADGKITVAPLPEKSAVLLALLLDPGGGGFLKFLQERCLTDGACQSQGNMDVINGAANAISLAITVAANGSQLAVHPQSDFGVKPGAALFGAKDNVKDDLAEGLRHIGLRYN